MIDRTFPPKLLLALVVGYGLAACEPAEPEPIALPEEVAAVADDCLLLVWANQDQFDENYDRANDEVEGGAISCATGTSASQFEAAIASIREAARSGDKVRMLEEVGIPLVLIDADGKQRELTDPALINKLFCEVFDERTLAALQQLELDDITVVKDEGAFADLGAIWFVVPEPGARPRIVTVNHQALDEAAEAVIREAGEEKGG